VSYIVYIIYIALIWIL